MAKKKRYIVVPRTEAAMNNGLATTKGNFSFGGKTARIVDESLASEIDTQHGLKGSGDVWVERDENFEWHEHHDRDTDGRKVGIHHYTFSGVDLSHLKPRKDTGLVWVRDGLRQIRMSRIQAEEEGYEIVETKIGDNRDAKHGKHQTVHRNVNN